MDTLENLSQEKKERIINAALEVFSKYDYQKASVSDIAKRAGISKPMMFTYFGSKRNCYEYMCNEMIRVSMEEFDKYKDKILSEDDFFERVQLSARIKISIFKKRPSLLTFATYFLKEGSDEVQQIKMQTINQGYKLREMFLSKGIDKSKFKNPDDAERVSKIAEWVSAGCAEEWSRTSSTNDIDKIMKEFIECIVLLKKHFYKEEYI